MYENMKELFADSNEQFMEKLDNDAEKLKCIYSKWQVREYRTVRWFYNDLESSEYKEIIFSSLMGALLQPTVYSCVFEEYMKGCDKWPDATIQSLADNVGGIQEARGENPDLDQGVPPCSAQNTEVDMNMKPEDVVDVGDGAGNDFDSKTIWIIRLMIIVLLLAMIYLIHSFMFNVESYGMGHESSL